MDQTNVGRIELAALGPLPPWPVLAPDAPNPHLPNDDGGLVPPRAVLGRQVGGEGGEVLDLRPEEAKGGGQPLGVGGGGEKDGGLLLLMMMLMMATRRGRGRVGLCWAAGGGRCRRHADGGRWRMGASRRRTYRKIFIY